MLHLAPKACSNKANIVQHCCANNVAQCWMKILTMCKLKLTSSNIIQHHPTLSNIIQHYPNIIQHYPNIFQDYPTSSNIVFKWRQHVVSNNVGCCCSNMLASFEQALSPPDQWKLYPIIPMMVGHQWPVDAHSLFASTWLTWIYLENWP